MAHLQATWTPDGRLFFWSPETHVEPAIEEELPDILGVGRTKHRFLAQAGAQGKRARTRGQQLSIVEALPALARLGVDVDVADSVKCWAAAAKLGLELAARQRVVPSVGHGEARWKVQFARESDVRRFGWVVQALPVASRAVPIRETGRGAIRLLPAEHAVRTFLDAIVDAVYRQEKHPGASRGWVRELADALRGADPAFAPRDARFQGVPDMLKAWTDEAEAAGLRVGLALGLPQDEAGTRFPVKIRVHPPGSFDHGRTVAEAWRAGGSLEVDSQQWRHPAQAVVQGLARASRIFDPLHSCLNGKIPHEPVWSAKVAWAFLEGGAAALEEAGLEVRLPEEFAAAGKQRIRARMRIEAATDEHGRLDLERALSFRWEVTLGDLVLEGAEFAELVSLKRPIVRFRGEWVLLDPKELARLPGGLPREGTLPAAEALRAVLIGEMDGIPVVADDRLDLLLEALRNPPEVDAPADLIATLRPYQAVGLSWLTTLGKLGLGACLADDMGLGKTIQLIAHLLARKPMAGGRPSLVVCPTSVLGNWQRELQRFAPSLKAQRYHGLNRSREAIDNTDVVLTTYGLLVRDQDELCKVAWDVVALDEAQAIKNPDSQRAKAARRIRARHRVAMSGTPVENRLDELWSLMEFLVPKLLGPRATFRRNVAVPVERFGDEEVARKLKMGVSPFLLRRVKTDPTVIDDLPDKIERQDYVPLTAEQADLYKFVVDDYMSQIEAATDVERRGHVLAMLTALKQVCNHPSQYMGDEGDDLADRSGKLERCIELLDQIFDNGEFCLIFTQYREMGSRLQRHISEVFGEDVPFLHGGTPPRRRDEIVQEFQENADAAPVLLISLRAGGTGLNLTRATHVIHYDRWWNPAVEDQATDRAYRIGQDQTVQVHKMVCQGTLEERIANLLDEKRALAESIVGSGERWVTELDDDALRQLVALGDDAVLD
ncbi:MAG: superfamily II DNA or RNA helicase [Myxococcota bacterium]|jgi:superfamily II DNA or RNA helicase